MFQDFGSAFSIFRIQLPAIPGGRSSPIGPPMFPFSGTRVSARARWRIRGIKLDSAEDAPKEISCNSEESNKRNSFKIPRKFPPFFGRAPTVFDFPP